MAKKFKIRFAFKDGFISVVGVLKLDNVKTGSISKDNQTITKIKKYFRTNFRPHITTWQNSKQIKIKPLIRAVFYKNFY